MRSIPGPTRRDVLQLGVISWLGLTLPPLLAGRAASAPKGSPPTFGRAKRCLLLFLTGGPPQHDTWDPKPDAPEKIRGEFRPIATSVPGLSFSELFPKLATRADRLCVVRSVTHADNVHTSAGYAMLTGVRHPNANAKNAASIQPEPTDHPHLGAILASTRPRGPAPAFVSLPESIKDANVNRFPGLGGGLLGASYDPLLIEADDARADHRLPELSPLPGVTARRLDDREGLLDRLDRRARRIDAAGLRTLDTHQARAFDLIRSPTVRAAFDTSAEPASLREAYGPHLFGRGCLLARRLLEAGVALAAVYWHYEGPDDSPVWDTHWNNFRHLRDRLAAPADAAIAATLDDLRDRGMLDDTLVIVMGEFGRTPKINKEAGRDHWAGAQTILLAGAGIRAGSVYGATDRDGAHPAREPVTPADLMATFHHLLGLPEGLTLRDRSGRPAPACAGKIVQDLIG